MGAAGAPGEKAGRQREVVRRRRAELGGDNVDSRRRQTVTEGHQSVSRRVITSLTEMYVYIETWGVRVTAKILTPF